MPTKLLEDAFAAAARLPDAEQEAFAALMLSELEDEARWQRAFASSMDVLEALGADALAEFRAGRTRPLRLADDLPND
jgi:hypothetical protein